MSNDRKGGEIIASRRNGSVTYFIIRKDIRENLYDGDYHIDTINANGTIQKGGLDDHDVLIQRLLDAVDMDKL